MPIISFIKLSANKDKSHSQVPVLISFEKVYPKLGQDKMEDSWQGVGLRPIRGRVSDFKLRGGIPYWCGYKETHGRHISSSLQ